MLKKQDRFVGYTLIPPASRACISARLPPIRKTYSKKSYQQEEGEEGEGEINKKKKNRHLVLRNSTHDEDNTISTTLPNA